MMSRSGLLFLGLAAASAAIALFVALPGKAGSDPGPVAAPAVFASPLNGGCYIAAPNDCRIHIEPLTVNIASGSQLKAVRVQANGNTVYDFTTDVSNPPPPSGTTYTLSTVAQDFAARCGETYVINVLGKDSQDANFLNMGQTASFTCPAAVP